eukprot:1159329-Pelagomonas_calceolata.AAC.1
MHKGALVQLALLGPSAPPPHRYRGSIILVTVKELPHLTSLPARNKKTRVGSYAVLGGAVSVKTF